MGDRRVHGLDGDRPMLFASEYGICVDGQIKAFFSTAFQHSRAS